MPKKKNAFYSFMLEYKRENKIDSQEEAMQKADAIWRSMTDYEKKMYADRRGNKGSKTESAPLNPVEIRNNEEALFKQTMIEEISSEIAIAKKYQNLPTCKFFVIHINSLCMQTQTNRHYPCEIGISAFSLKYGVSKNDVFDAIVYPGALPYGYTALAKQISNESHQIPWEYDDMDNQEEIFEALVKFLRENTKGSPKMPVLYALPRNMELVKIVLDTWCEDFNPRLNFTVYNVRTLCSLLHKNVVENSRYSSESISYLAFEKDIHQYAQETACEFHQSIDAPVECSRSKAIRSCYTICENVCPELKIDLLPGEHIPFNSLRNSKVEKKSSKLNEDSSTTVREDSSDIETVVSYGKMTSYDDDSSSSITFPEYEEHKVSSRKKISDNDNVLTSGGSGNYSNDFSSRTGSSGFSKKPAALPSNVNEAFTNLALNPESSDRRKEQFPSLRGRGGGVRGRGRGHPFRKF